MPRILVSGYYGFDNVGDDTVLFGILSEVRSLSPQAQFAVLSNQPERTRELFEIESYNRWNFGTIVRELMKADLLLMGGGTLMQDVTSHRSIPYYLSIVALAKLLGKPVVFYGQGFGPVGRSVSRRIIRLIANRIDLITVRDDKSADDFRRCGVKRPPLYVTADPALGIDLHLLDTARGRSLLDKIAPASRDTGPMVGVAIRDWSTGEDYIKGLASACDELVDDGCRVVFLPMQYPTDVEASRSVDRLMQNEAVVLDRHLTFRDVASVIANFDLVIGMRLHSLILAALGEVPFVPISYDPKINRFVQRIGLGPSLSVHSFDGAGLLERSRYLLSHRSEGRQIIREHLPELRSEALRTAELAVALLKKKS